MNKKIIIFLILIVAATLKVQAQIDPYDPSDRFYAISIYLWKQKHGNLSPEEWLRQNLDKPIAFLAAELGQKPEDVQATIDEWTTPKRKVYDWSVLHKDTGSTREEWFKQNYGKIPMRVISEELGLSKYLLRRKAFFLGIIEEQFDWKLMHKDTGLTRERWLVENYEKLTAGEIAKEFGISESAVYGKAHALGIMDEAFDWKAPHKNTGITYEEWLLDVYERTDTKVIARELGISRGAVYAKAFNLRQEGKQFRKRDLIDDMAKESYDFLIKSGFTREEILAALEQRLEVLKKTEGKGKKEIKKELLSRLVDQLWENRRKVKDPKDILRDIKPK